MAPSFLSKFKSSSTTQSQSRDTSTSESHPARSPSPNRRKLTSFLASNSNSANNSAVPSIITTDSTVEGNESTTSVSTNPSVTVIPPSPLSTSDGFPHMYAEGDASNDKLRQQPNGLPKASSPTTSKDHQRSMSFSLSPTPSAFSDDGLPTPTSLRPGFGEKTGAAPTFSPTTGAHSRTLTPSSSTGNLRDFVRHPTPPPAPKRELPQPAAEVRKKVSNKSIKSITSNKSGKSSKSSNKPIPAPLSVSHMRAATTPAVLATPRNSGETAYGISPIVESPKGFNSPPITASPEQIPHSGTSLSPTSLLLPPRAHDPDTASIASTNTNTKPPPVSKPQTKRTWRRGSAARKPTGLASAIAASGLAMANPTLSAHHQAQLAAPMAQLNGTSKSPPARRPSNTSTPYMGPPSASTSTRQGSADFSPYARSSNGKANRTRRRTDSTSLSVSAHSEEYADEFGAYSGIEDDSGGDDSESEDDLMDLDLGEDIPVTGFAVASKKRNDDFHDLFPSIPEGDYLIEDYGCALQREILIQGRIYISENHICFHANIFGWITNLSIPIYEIMTLEKKMTAFVIPNAIQITTRQNKYTFASFLSRDTTFDVIFNIWRLARPEDSVSMTSASPRGSLEDRRTGLDIGDVGVVAKVALARKVTQCACGKAGQHFSETILDTILPGTPDGIYNLVFASGFIKDFMRVDQKLMDIQISDWTPTSADSKLLARNMSYIKPLTGSLGPKQTKCEIRDEVVHCDFDDYVCMLTTTRTPDVPSGGVFSVKTRTCIMWASAASTRVIVTTQVEWTGRSFIKGIIEKSCLDGQRVYHADLEKAMREYIKEHMAEFMPEGVDLASVAAVEPVAAISDGNGTAPPDTPTEEARKMREHERNRRGLQWAWDTFEGASQVAKQSTKGALELIRDAWDQSTSTTILYFIIVLLVLSNIWTLMRMGYKEEAGRRKEMRKTEEREKWVQGVVTALWDEMSAAKAAPIDAGGVSAGVPPMLDSSAGTAGQHWREEIVSIQSTLDAVEERVRRVKESLGALQNLNAVD